MRAAGSSAGDWTAGRSWSCHCLRYTNVRTHFGMHSIVRVVLRGRAGTRRTGTIMASKVSGLCWFCTGFAGDASSSVRWMRGGLLAVRPSAQKGPRKCCNCAKSDAYLVIGFPTREEKGKKGVKEMHHWGCITFMQKSAKEVAPRERVFELILTGKSTRQCGCSRLAMHNFCTGFVDIMERSELNGKETLQAWSLPDVYDSLPQHWDAPSPGTKSERPCILAVGIPRSTGGAFVLHRKQASRRKRIWRKPDLTTKRGWDSLAFLVSEIV